MTFQKKSAIENTKNIFFKWDNPGLFLFIISLCNQTFEFYNKSMWKNVHPVYGTGIRTHDLSYKSRLP